jgi:uncharacterized protein (TIGR00369 family)
MGRWATILDGIASGRPEPIPFVNTLQMPGITRWERGRIWQEWTVRSDLFHPRGALFGGYLAALADRALGLVTMTVLEDDEAFTTADLNVSFFRPVSGGVLHIQAEVIHRGRSLIQAEATFTRDDGKLAAKASASQAVIPYQEPVQS